MRVMICLCELDWSHPYFFTAEAELPIMAYFGIDSERYGGWSEEEKEAALENAELSPDRVPGDDDE